MVRHKKIKRIIFLTGTRADFSKIKSLLIALNVSPDFEIHLVVTGMHFLAKHGLTHQEVDLLKIQRVYKLNNQCPHHSLDQTLAYSVRKFSAAINLIKPDLIIVHGDRVEALAMAIVGAFNNILVGHIEGGEVSGTIDESIRHAVSKLSHLHFVTNTVARNRLLQMGENIKHIFIIGSPNLDILSSKNLPNITEVKSKHLIKKSKYAIVLYHPVTTEIDTMFQQADQLIKALLASDLNYIVIYPNNDPGSEIIFNSYHELHSNPRFGFYPNLPFEDFIVLLKNSLFLIGNSSSGVYEAPFFGVPSINIGTRQQGRASVSSVINCPSKTDSILRKIRKFSNRVRFPSSDQFRTGNSAKLFIKIIKRKNVWSTNIQKHFNDILPSNI